MILVRIRIVQILVAFVVAATANVVLGSDALAADASATAKAMVAAFRENRGVGALPAMEAVGKLDETTLATLKAAAKGATDLALETTGERLEKMQQFDVLVAVIGWYSGRNYNDAAVVETINARTKLFNAETARQFQSALKTNSPTLAMAAVVFQGHVFAERKWKPGHPAVFARVFVQFDGYHASAFARLSLSHAMAASIASRSA